MILNGSGTNEQVGGGLPFSQAGVFSVRSVSVCSCLARLAVTPVCLDCLGVAMSIFPT